MQRAAMENTISSSPHFQLQEQANTLVVVLPVRKNWHHIFYTGGFAFGLYPLALLLCGLLFATFTDRVDEFSPPSSTLEVLQGLWAFFIFGLMGVLGWLGFQRIVWQFFGREIVTLTPQAIKIGTEVLGFRRSREYASEHIKHLRTFVSERGRFEWDIGAVLWNRVQGLIGFDYGTKTVRFGSSLDLAEAKQILAAIQQRFPQYRN